MALHEHWINALLDLTLVIMHCGMQVECEYLSWEEVSESDLCSYQPDVV